MATLTSRHPAGLLSSDDPEPIAMAGPALAIGPFVLLGDHAGDRIPRKLDRLGLTPDDLARHIALDIGVGALGREMSQRLNAPFVSQRFSRLVIDCNRDPGREDAVPVTSDGTAVPGNRGLSDLARRARVAAIHAPYHAAIAALLDTRGELGLRTVLVSLHSFTPVMAGEARPWTLGVLRDGGPDRFAAKVLGVLRDEPGIVLGDNRPYAFDATDYTIPRHAVARGLEWVELEVRQDQLGTQRGVEAVAGLLARALVAADASRAQE